MGRRKIEIKAIKDDRNRSVTFLKRKGGLFKKAHELSVLCSVDVAVFIFGNNKKLYEYSSTDMREMITRYTYHGGPTEHKGPSDFNGGNDEEEEEDDNGTPPIRESMEPQMLPPHFQGQPGFPHMRHHEPSASPPINGMHFQQHPGQPGPRSHTPQPQMGSRPASRQDIRRIGQQQQPPPPPQQQPVNGYAFMPNPAIYTPQNQQNMQQHGMPQQGPQYPAYPPNHQQQPHQPHQQQQQQQQQQQHMQYLEDQRRASMPPTYPQNTQGPQVSRISPSPPQPNAQQLPQQHQQSSHVSPPPPQPQQLEPQHHQEGAMLAPTEPVKQESRDKPRAPLLNTDYAIKKMPQRKQHSIFTPIDENRSILSQHLASFAAADSSASKSDAGIKIESVNRSQSVDVGAVSRTNGHTSSPPLPQQSDSQGPGKGRNVSIAAIPETTFTPPSRSNSMKLGSVGGGGGARPRLRVEIPDEPSDEQQTATGASETQSPRTQADPAATQAARRPEGQASNMVLPPPSPSASALLSAGATGPPNPFARPAPQPNNNMNIDTPVSALPSRFLNNEFLPSPSSFDTYWYQRGGNDSNTLPSPLNFATPVVGQGPSFLREDNPPIAKRKTPEIGSSESTDTGGDAKRPKVES
ncbi:hypothetical protein VD0002_g9307 [Verticillium dahliae]|uniref:MADS-box MEF2 type transcription factor MIG1 n=2 Tax=Verticillium dahliae TaxID=27337 RepID=G2WT16_VERDV|nr:MADS-box MEF2 type transcription factor [Verticillium dahliae VdLs.17]KAF3348729.1 Phosphatidylinositol-3,4,5-trisphosphate 3-phosphatase and dual-specificity protein phosphatase PTEN [Verticillium dahliae VDG2]KAH6701641.1 MADS-box MEF2 type transcription factor [Verticillium dahliae]EGY17257.1 MADS-box MEF2 type transcription factor [Verticillium dahliae VdLs.17]PNH32575.1 hypothetical protein BJF96_g4277 [Verticillium dahliae]PNH58221.1 hypothetical protein VD0002_g9307 [Verticillium dah